MTTPVTNTINVVVGTVLALCAIGALCLNFWKAPKPVDEKLVILRSLVELSCVAAVVAICCLLMFSDRVGLLILFGSYPLLVRYAIFAFSPVLRVARKSLPLVVVAVFTITTPSLQNLKASVKVLSTIPEAQHAMVQNESHIVSILERLALTTASPSPSPTPDE